MTVLLQQHIQFTRIINLTTCEVLKKLIRNVKLCYTLFIIQKEKRSKKLVFGLKG